jgi:Spy/CpxP family protein refolding chaperone
MFSGRPGVEASEEPTTMTQTILAQIFSMMTLLVAPAAADEVGDHVRRSKGAGICERIECTNDQRVAIDGIRAEIRKEREGARAEAKRLHDALKAEEAKARPDPQVIAKLRAELEANRAAHKQAKMAAKAEIAALLTPEQRERLAAMKAERGEKGKAHGKRSDGEHGKAKAHGKRGDGEHGKGKAHAKRSDGEHGKGKAHAKRERGGKAAFVAG